MAPTYYGAGEAGAKESEQELTEETEREYEQAEFGHGCEYSRRGTGRDDTDFPNRSKQR